MAIAVMTPILLFFILAALLYLPPVQNWAVKKVAAIASEKTGMEITVGHVNLEWPLDLGIDDFRMLHPNDSLKNITDTIADIGHHKESVEVNGARLADADLDIQLSDTAAVDTTTSENKWTINADSLSIYQTRLAIHLPGDTLHIDTYMGHAVAKEANIDLGKSIYEVSSLRWNDGRLSYDNRFEPSVAGLDYNHIDIKDISLGIDSISYTPQGTSFYIRNTSLKEKSGLEITQLEGGVEITLSVRLLKIPVRLLVALSHHIACCIEHAQMKQTACIAFFSKHLPPGEVVHQFAHAQNRIPGF